MILVRQAGEFRILLMSIYLLQVIMVLMQKAHPHGFYNGYNTDSNFANYGIVQSTITDLTGGPINNAVNVRQYPGYTLSITTDGTIPNSRTGWIFSFPDSKYSIGNIPTTGIRGTWAEMIGKMPEAAILIRIIINIKQDYGPVLLQISLPAMLLDLILAAPPEMVANWLPVQVFIRRLQWA